MEPIQTLNVVGALSEYVEVSGLEEAYQIESDIKILKMRIKALEERRAEIIDDAIETGNLVQEDALGNRYELKDKGRTVRTLDLNLLWQNHPEAFRQIVKNARWEVDPFVAMESLTEAEIVECSVFSPEVMGQKFPEIFERIATPCGGSALVGDAKGYLGEKQIDACSTVRVSPAWKLEYVLGENAGLGKKARAAKGAQ